MSQYSIHYYDLMIEACASGESGGGRVHAQHFPRFSAVRWDATKAYLDSRGVPRLNLMHL